MSGITVERVGPASPQTTNGHAATNEAAPISDQAWSRASSTYQHIYDAVVAGVPHNQLDEVFRAAVADGRAQLRKNEAISRFMQLLAAHGVGTCSGANDMSTCRRIATDLYRLACDLGEDGHLRTGPTS